MDFDGIFFNTDDFIMTPTVIGQGSSGSVCLVNKIDNNEVYAAKICKSGLYSGIDQQLFMREALILSKIVHPAILKFYGINFHSFDQPDMLQPTILTEYLRNGSLKGTLDKERNSIADYDWTPTKKCICLLGIAHAMKYVHKKGIIHRDLKPENILLDENFYPRICDFGLSRKFHRSHGLSKAQLSMTGKIGTPLYMAPELLIDEDKYTFMIDVYSFAILACELITGEEPYSENGKRISLCMLIKKIGSFARPQFNENVTGPMKILIQKAWSQVPEERPSFADIYQELSSNPQDYFSEVLDVDEVIDYISYLEDFSNEESKLHHKRSRRHKRSEKSKSESSEKVISETTEKADSKNEDESSSKMIHEANEHSENQYTEKVDDKSTEKVDDKSTEKVDDKSIEKVDDKSTEKVDDKSTEKVDDKSTEKVYNENAGYDIYDCFIGQDEEENFETVGKLGEGLTSVVYKIVDKRTLKPLCKKVLKVEGASLKDVQNAIKEFQVLHTLKHPSICYAIAINTSESLSKDPETGDEVTTVAIFLEFIDFNLKDCLTRSILNNTLKARIVVEICHGMRYLHAKGMIYRDLKLDNIMLNSVYHVKLIDFGLVRVNECLFGEESLSSVSMTKGVGMALFMSPEMMKEEDYDNKTDVFSFGIILFYIFVGKMPHQTLKEKAMGKDVPLPAASKDVSESCVKLISMCLQNDPKERPSFEEIILFLRENKFMLADDVDPSFVDVRDKELEMIKA